MTRQSSTDYENLKPYTPFPWRITWCKCVNEARHQSWERILVQGESRSSLRSMPSPLTPTPIYVARHTPSQFPHPLPPLTRTLYDMHAVSHGTREALGNYPKTQEFQQVLRPVGDAIGSDNPSSVCRFPRITRRTL